MTTKEDIILEPEDWTEEEYKTIKKLFGVERLESVSRITIRKGIEFTVFCNLPEKE